VISAPAISAAGSGQVTAELAGLMRLLVERYAMRSNWRNYPWIEKFKSAAVAHLFDVGLQFDENKGQNAISYFTSVAHNTIVYLLKRELRQLDVI
jgi:hypothetical protein